MEQGSEAAYSQDEQSKKRSNYGVLGVDIGTRIVHIAAGSGNRERT
jgi:hypothetical protein